MYNYQEVENASGVIGKLVESKFNATLADWEAEIAQSNVMRSSRRYAK